jgi:thioredoxin-like negative regulator of GroEL
LDVLLAITLGWTELVDQSSRIALWTVFGVAWVVGVGWSARTCRRRIAGCNPDPQRDGFPDAVQYYLKGDYYQAEVALQRLVKENTGDVDARLMLATLLRRAGRFDEAVGQLDLLTLVDGAEKWQLEITQERQRLAKAKVQAAENSVRSTCAAAVAAA